MGEGVTRPTWIQVQAPPAIEPSSCHVWRAGLELTAGRAEALRQLLSADERPRSERFLNEEASRRFLAARCFLRILLATYCGTSPERIEFAYTRHGKPYLANSDRELCFSLSHSHRMALVAVAAARAVGADLEMIRRLDFRRLARSALSRREIAGLDRPAAGSRDFLEIWTRKEAYAKAIGRGLTLQFDRVELGSPTPRGNDDDLPTARTSDGFVVHDVVPATGYVGAVTCRGHARLRLLELESWERSRAPRSRGAPSEARWLTATAATPRWHPHWSVEP